MIKLISLDLDGTLLDPKGRITSASKAAIARAKEAGLRVVINTGRNAPEAAWFARETGCDLLTSSVGGALVSDAGAGRTICRRDMPESSGRRALELCLGWGFRLMIFAGEETLVSSRYKKFLEQHYLSPAFHATAIVTDDPLAYIGEHRLPLTKLHGELDPSQYPLELLAELEGVAITSSSSHDVELLPAQADKGQALALIAAQYGIRPEECAAVGDSENDLPAFHTVGLPIAMGNAPDHVKAAAACTAPSHTQEGAAWAISHCLKL